MKTTEHTPIQPGAAVGAIVPATGVAKNAVGTAAPAVPSDESYRIAASLAHRPGS